MHRGPRAVRFIEREWKGGCQGPEVGGGEMGSYCSMGTEFQFCKMERALEVDSGDGCVISRMDLRLLNRTLKNG